MGLRRHHARRHTRRATAALLATLALGGCGTSGYGTVNAHQLVLIPTAASATAAVRRADAALVCSARAEAHRLHRALSVERPRTANPSAQIAVANAVTAEKPGGVLIVPVAPNPMLAPILSMRRAGIRVVRLREVSTPHAAAAQGARGVAAVVRAIDPKAPAASPSMGPVSLLARCGSAH